jgi:DegV family protein with EDD domain
MKTAIITDSASNLDKKTLNIHSDLYTIPLLIMIDGESYRDQVDISSEEVYAKLDSHKVSTSLPSIEDFFSLLGDLEEKGYEKAFFVTISSGLSGTYNAIRNALEAYEGVLKVTLYDSKTLGAAQGYLATHAQKRLSEGIDEKSLIEELNTLRYEDSIAIYSIDTLKYLRRGGRIGKVEGAIGGALRVKPVITVNDDGVYVTLSKTIGSFQRAMLSMKKLMVKKFKDHPIHLTIHYGNNFDKAKEQGEKLKSALNIKTLALSQLTPVLGIHTGPRMLAYVAKRIK